MILRLLCIWLVFLIIVIADARNHEPEMTNLMHKFFNILITVLYMYMFGAISCSSSGGQILLIQHLASSLSVSDHPVHTLRKNEVLSQSR
jgi:glucan phosphoethanolaminetransferase (alkaline phosphatase superfamily)